MKILIRLIFSLIILLSYSSKALSQEPPSEIVNHGAFSTMMIAAPDIAKYLETVKEDVDFFGTLGSAGTGSCITMSGHEYLGQMMIWNAYPNVQTALEGSAVYDPTQEAGRRFQNLREVKYVTTWKPLKPFRLDPGYERVQRVKIPPQNLAAFVAGMSALETAIQEGGHGDFFNGVFVPIGGGSHEATTLMVRSVTRDESSMGTLFDEYFSGTATWAPTFDALQQAGGTIVSDTFEKCEQFYFGK